MRLSRTGEPRSGGDGGAAELARAVWALAAAYDEPDQADAARGHALRAGALAGGTALDVSGQVRSTAVDLRRAADILAESRRAGPRGAD